MPIGIGIGIGITIGGVGLSGDPVPSIQLSGLAIAEDAEVGDLVGTLSVANFEGEGTFSLGDGTSNLLELDESDDTRVLVAGALDYETLSELPLFVIFTPSVGDAIGPREFTISVTNVLEVTLNELSLDADEITENSAEDTVIGAVVGKSSGSTLSLIDDAGGRFKLSGTNIVAGATNTDYEAATSYNITLRETHPDASNSPNDTVIPITVVDDPDDTDTVPAAFEVGDWSIAAGDEEADVTISSLPADGGDTITDIEYRVDGGSPVSSGTDDTTGFTIPSLTNDQEYDVQIRAVNSVGAGAWSDTKQVTPEAAGGWHPNDLSSPPLAVWDPTVSGSLWQDTSATTPAADGDPLGRIDDQSTNGNNALQSTDTKRPTFDIISGVPWIVCDGTDDGMNFTNVKPAMVAAVFYTTHIGNTFQTLFTNIENGPGTNDIRVHNSGSQPGNFRAVGASADGGDFCNNTGETRINDVATATFSNATPSIITVESGSASGQSTEGLAAFGLPGFTDRQWRGRIGRIVLLSALPSSEEYNSLLSWLAEPYGISL